MRADCHAVRLYRTSSVPCPLGGIEFAPLPPGAALFYLVPRVWEVSRIALLLLNKWFIVRRAPYFRLHSALRRTSGELTELRCALYRLRSACGDFLIGM